MKDGTLTIGIINFAQIEVWYILWRIIKWNIVICFLFGLAGWLWWWWLVTPD